MTNDPPVPDIGEVRRVAVLTPQGIGDVVFCLPALEALRAAFPAAELILLGPWWTPSFFDRRPGPVDRAVAAPPVRQHDADDAPFFERMRGLGLDVALQMFGGGRESNPWVRRLGARLSVGFAAPEAPSLDLTVPYRYYQHEIARRLEAVALLGARPVTFDPHIAVTGDDVRESLEVVSEDDRPIAVLLPGSGDGRRRWTPAGFAHVGDSLAAEGARVVVCGGPSDSALGREVTAAMRSPAEDACGRLSLSGLAGLLSRAGVVCGNDTGPLHLAEAVGAATVGVYWCGNVVTAAASTRSRHRVLMSWTLACPECGVSCVDGECAHDVSFVSQVEAGEVASEALDVLHGSR